MTKLSLNASIKTKHTPAGDIPVDWASRKLGELVAQPISGVSVVADDNPPESGNPGVLRLSCVSRGRFNPADLKTPQNGQASRLSVYAEQDTILISRSNTPSLVGASAYVSDDFPTSFLPDTLWLLRAKDPTIVSMRWLSYLIRSDDYRQALQNIASGTSQSMKKIQKGALLKLNAPTPPLPEQRNIADILSTWDDALETLDALIAAKTRQKQALMQQLLTGRTRVKGFSKPWMTAKLGTLINERVEQGRGDLPLLSITADRGIVPREDVAKRDSSSEDKSKYLRIAPGDIGYNTMRMWQGVSALSTLEGIVSPAYTICTPTDRIDGRFAAHFFKLRHTVHLFHRYSQGLVDDTLNLKFPSFAVIEVSVASDLEEQRQIAAILDTADQELTLLRAQRNALDQQKRGLMQRLLTGKIRVKI